MPSSLVGLVLKGEHESLIVLLEFLALAKEHWIVPVW